jgi:hypothetical protein
MNAGAPIRWNEKPVVVMPPEQNLHYAWDDAVVVELVNEAGYAQPQGNRDRFGAAVS